MSGPRLAVVLSGFPRRSETFALNELLALEAHGLLGKIFATKPGDGSTPQPGTEQLLHRVELLREATPERQGAEAASRLVGSDVAGIHAYFAHTPTAVAAAAAGALRVPYGFSVHARDARKIDQCELARRGRDAACVIACNTDVAGELRQVGVDVHLIPHGVDLERFRPRPFPPDWPLRLLAVGRLVPKKGFYILLRAVARLSIPFRLDVVGDGSERASLSGLAAALELRDRVAFLGAATHDMLPSIYAESHAVVVPSVQDETGDRDGLPNVVLEAMASERPVAASDVGAIGSAVAGGETGLLVPPGDVAALAQALEAIADPAVRNAMGHASRLRVERDYELGRCTDRLHRLLTAAYV